MLAAFQALGGGERALLVLAPRHPERWDEAARLLAGSGVAWQRRSAMERQTSVRRETSTAPAVVLLDSLGELAALYRLAAGCFVGGTLAATGGHNPLEPARFGRAIAVGPSMENFRDMAAQFDAAAAWRRVAGADELAAAWREWLHDPGRGAGAGRARAAGRRGQPRRAAAHVGRAGAGAGPRRVGRRGGACRPPAANLPRRRGRRRWSCPLPAAHAGDRAATLPFALAAPLCRGPSPPRGALERRGRSGCRCRCGASATCTGAAPARRRWSPPSPPGCRRAACGWRCSRAATAGAAAGRSWCPPAAVRW